MKRSRLVFSLALTLFTPSPVAWNQFNLTLCTWTRKAVRVCTVLIRSQYVSVFLPSESFTVSANDHDYQVKRVQIQDSMRSVTFGLWYLCIHVLVASNPASIHEWTVSLDP
jgi:hypothetical protein